MLRAVSFTLSALDTSRCFPHAKGAGVMIVIAFGHLDLPVTEFADIIHQLEKVRDADFLRTAIGTVAAAGAGDAFLGNNNLGNLLYKLLLTLRQGLKIGHIGASCIIQI